MNIKSFYCCGKLKSVSLTFKSEQTKSEQKTSIDNNCCKTTFQKFQVKDNHFVSADVNVPAKQFVQVDFIPNLYIASTFTLTEAKFVYQSNAPPLNTNIPLYISNCVFRI